MRKAFTIKEWPERKEAEAVKKEAALVGEEMSKIALDAAAQLNALSGQEFDKKSAERELQKMQTGGAWNQAKAYAGAATEHADDVRPGSGRCTADGTTEAGR